MQHTLRTQAHVLLLPLLAACASTGGQAPAPTQPTRPACDDALVISCAGLDELLVDERDQGLKRALLLVDERINELPDELGFDAPPESAMALVTRILQGSKELRLGLRDGAFPVYAQLRLPEADTEAARRTEDLLADLIELAGGRFSPPVSSRDELRRVALLPAMGIFAWFGVPESAGDECLVALAQASAGPAAIGSAGLPRGVEPLIALVADGAKLGRLGETIQGMIPDASAPNDDDGQGDDGSGVSITFELDIPEVTTSLAMGKGEERTHMASVTWDYRPVIEETCLLSEEDLSQSLLGKIPADAICACAGTANLPGILDTIMTLAYAEIDELNSLPGNPLDLLAMLTGLHPQRDLFDHLGSSWGAWLSDTGGGGGFLSGVAVVELPNPEPVAETFGRIRMLANGFLRTQTDGYVRMRRWTRPGPDGDLQFGTLTFPGLPVPLEITCAVAEGCAWFGLTPQSVVGSVEHAARGGDRLIDRRDFRAAGGADLGGLASLSWVDTPALMADGYGMATLAASALANATRSPRKRSRDAGLVLPTFADLSEGARPFLCTSRWDGDDLLTRATADRSLVANLTAMAGLLSRTPLPYVVPAVAGAILGSQRRGRPGRKHQGRSDGSHTVEISVSAGSDG